MRLGSGVGGGSRIVADDALDVERVLVLTAGELGDGAEPVVAGALGGADYNVVALADADGDGSGVVRVHGDEVGRDDLQGVVINHELPHGVDGGVDEAHAVRLAGLESCGEAGASAIVHACAVDETGLGAGRAVAGGFAVELVGGAVEPVAQDDCAEILIVGG